ncbi:MAG: S9 family peptidase [Bryobacteraceae bacterium]|nr:S9 family peptidase [Bryobacteraceae bacterium]
MRLALFTLFAALTLSAQPRPITLDDLHRVKAVGDPRCSPDAKWIAYTVSTVDVAGDKRDTDIWMASVDGKENFRLTTSPESESSPKWSPDGRYLSFLSSRPGKAKGSQVWVMDRRGGEAQQFTEVKGRLSYFEWSPDAKKLALIIKEDEDEKKDDKKPAEAEKPKPIVVDRYAFKRDGAGYISGTKRSRIFLYDIATKKTELVTTENFDESSPVWSPDGTKLAFTSNRAADGDRVPNSDVWVVDAKAGSVARKLTEFTGSDTQPVWSPDGKMIAYLVGSEHKMGEYNMSRLAIVPVEGGAPKILTASLNRGVNGHQFTEDGRQLEFLVADDMSMYPARVSVTGGAVERMVGGKLAMMSIDRAGACAAALVSTDVMPAEVHVLEGSTMKKLTSHNDELLKGLQLVTPEEVSFKGKDGNEAHGLLFKPVNYVAGTKVPFLLRIHGGPNGQDQHSFRMEEQQFAAAGYGVLNVNYRGSSGRGQEYTVSIAGDWGHKEVIDLHAGIDHVVKLGIADPDKLGVGGWSYGGILTNYLIASDTRFKAGISGAGVAFPLAFYGHDQYIRQYDNEIGPPWQKGLEPWIKISYPFLHADRIKTPTMFLAGDKDFNVPLLGSEQMYQALRNVGTDSQLIIYPGENHGIARPSFQRDRMQRYLDWYAKYLKPAPASAPPTSGGND